MREALGIFLAIVFVILLGRAIEFANTGHPYLSSTLILLAIIVLGINLEDQWG